ncbi:substrate-binding domain-containing protein [Nonomuraea thailandensis]|uniref:substrate-binding domain-containing protein n=1 Tax=Nonomuraea thailandensis TaxID=1188745 RepID=UPI0027E2B386|nr:substrate-binding domain-containing protein [Nonomuraea thailandensis]
MLTEERHEAILRALRLNGSIKVSEVAAKLGVSSVTIRHDVRELAGRGLLRRVHGGATLLPEAEQTAPAEVGPKELASQDEKLVFGMVVPNTSYYYPEVIKGAQSAAARYGARLVLGVSHYDLRQEQKEAEQLLADGVHGILLTPSMDLASSPETGRWLESIDIPVVMVERRASFELGNVEQVASDHVFGAYLAVKHLAGLGHDHVALLAREESFTTPWLLQGHARALTAFGMRPAEPRLLIGSAEHDPAEMSAQIEQFADLVVAESVRAALVHNDLDAVQLIRKLMARGVSVPRDIAIVTYDDEVATMAAIPLTAVAPPKHAVGAAAVELLARRMADPDGAFRHLLLRPELRVRASCGA